MSIKESEFSERSGIARAEIRKLRKVRMVLGVDYEHDASTGAVLLRESGVRIVSEAFGLGDGLIQKPVAVVGQAVAPVEEKPVVAGVRARGVAKFVRQPRNRHICLAEIGGEAVRVMMKKPRVFKGRGAEMEVEQVRGDLWRLVGGWRK